MKVVTKLIRKLLKTITSYNFNEIDGEYHRVFFMKQVTKYDKTGNKTETVYYDSSKKLIMKSVNTDDEHNRFTIFHYDENENISKKQTCSFNNNDNIVCSTYNSDGKIIEKDSSPFKGKDIPKKFSYEVDKYDEQGNILKTTSNKDGKISKTRHNNQYDSYGNLSMITTYGIDGEREFPKHQLIFEYVYYP